MIVVLLGMPGAGKGTQADRLQERLAMPHVASGDLFRTNLRNGTALGQLAKGYMDRGELVPDEVVIKMILDRLAEPDCEHGVILDGFPRTVAQAEALESTLRDKGKRVDAGLYVTVSELVLLDRLSGRWICPKDQSTYHEKFNPPRNDLTCDICGTPLYQREDDKREVAQRRLQVYMSETAPVIDYYRQRGVLTEIDGEENIDDVTTALITAINDSEDQDDESSAVA